MKKLKGDNKNVIYLCLVSDLDGSGSGRKCGLLEDCIRINFSKLLRQFLGLSFESFYFLSCRVVTP
jgi:hypothetical protein